MPGASLPELWDPIIQDWLGGGATVSEELRPWLHSYRPTQSPHTVIADALPEPWFGDLARQPAMVFLALNPGIPFLGSERSASGRLMPDLQSRVGVFADEIRAAGSYSRWAERFPDWRRWMTAGNTFFERRVRFARAWLERPDLQLDDCLHLELYPWLAAILEVRVPPYGTSPHAHRVIRHRTDRSERMPAHICVRGCLFRRPSPTRFPKRASTLYPPW